MHIQPDILHVEHPPPAESQQDSRHCGISSTGEKVHEPGNVAPKQDELHCEAAQVKIVNHKSVPQQDSSHCEAAQVTLGGSITATAQHASTTSNGSPKRSQRDILHCAVSNQVPQELSNLNPESEPFKSRDVTLVHDGQLNPDLDADWEIVRNIHSGNSGTISLVTTRTWNKALTHSSVDVLHKPTVPMKRPTVTVNKNNVVTNDPSFAKNSTAAHLEEPLLPFNLLQDAAEAGFLAPAKPVLRVRGLQDAIVNTPFGPFIDKSIPAPEVPLTVRPMFTPAYFRCLHNLVAAPGIRADGSRYPANTPNFLGARIRLQHVGMKVEKWRFHLFGYEHVDLVQFIEFGFPLGLSELPDLQSCSHNHGSSYSYYPHVDKFMSEEVVKGGLVGPFQKAPWWNTIVSPIMTAPKKPDSRRVVFDATFGEKSLNNATPSDFYMGQPCIYTYPKIDDFRRMVLRCGKGSWLWKQDLSRFFLQIPMDPLEYIRVGLIWRGLFFFFCSLAFGLRHSGLQGQRITDGLSWIHRRRGLETTLERPFNCVNYSDDIGGVEETKSRATESFAQLGWLMEDLGLDESVKKAEPPSTAMTYLGVMFDTVRMEMRVPPSKLAEIKSEIQLWVRKSKITRRDLQSLLGKLFWISKVVRFSRVFMGRLLQLLRSMTRISDSTKVALSAESRKDLVWWGKYLDHFNGIQMIVEEDPFLLELDQMLDRPYDVCAGDATPIGCGAWHGKQYWCRPLPRDLQDTEIPIHLKEFWTMIVSARVWGEDWSGRCVTIFCDNDSVVDTINNKKPKDAALLSLLREFLYIVVTMKFIPVVRKISTKDNHLADFISRRHDVTAAETIFIKAGLQNMVPIEVADKSFKLTEPW